jgi:hypothetical protein
MDKEELLQLFINISPEFKEIWESDANFFREGLNYTSHGVCAEFSHYFIDNFYRFSEDNLKRLFEQIENVISRGAKDENETANALCTCFLENISQTEAGNIAKKYLGNFSKEYFEYWDK